MNRPAFPMTLQIAKILSLSFFAAFLQVSAFATLPMATPTSSNYYNIRQGVPWSPSISAPPSNGSGSKVFVVAHYTHWQSGSWTPTAPGTYTFHVGQLADSAHHGNATDPRIGELQINYSAYTVTVMPKLSVNLGSGSGDYPVGTNVSISAINPLYPNQVFDDWTAPDFDGVIANLYDRTTTFTLGSQNDNTVATYRNVNYSWSVSPSNPAHNATYNVSVGVDSGGFPGVTLSKEGATLSFGWFGTQANTSDSGPDTINFTASFSDSLNTSSGSSSRSVPIQAPPIDYLPNAYFNFSTNNLAATFDGSGSTDDNGISGYSWNFGDGSSGSGISPSHTYSSAGTYSVTLTVTDTADQTDNYTRSVSVNRPPIASFSYSTNGLSASFNGSSSSDPDGHALSYSWDFGDGASGSGANPSHTYALPGTYSVQLTVNDNGSPTKQDSQTRSVTVEDINQHPVASFTYTENNLVVSFDASGSSDDGSIVSYSWNFGDGGSGTGVSPSHTYVSSGTYSVQLTVTDNGSPALTDTQTRSVMAVQAGADSDSNGLPDSWEMQYSFDPASDAGPGEGPEGNPDGDRFSNWLEYLMGTDPRAVTTANGGNWALTIYAPIQ